MKPMVRPTTINNILKCIDEYPAWVSWFIELVIQLPWI
jgi:hypothetical protein